MLVPRPRELTAVTVEENGRTVWENDQFVPGDAGVSAAAKDADGLGIVFDLGSGEYNFRLRGQ